MNNGHDEPYSSVTCSLSSMSKEDRSRPSVYRKQVTIRSLHQEFQESQLPKHCLCDPGVYDTTQVGEFTQNVLCWKCVNRVKWSRVCLSIPPDTIRFLTDTDYAG